MEQCIIIILIDIQINYFKTNSEIKEIFENVLVNSINVKNLLQLIGQTR